MFISPKRWKLFIILEGARVCEEESIFIIRDLGCPVACCLRSFFTYAIQEMEIYHWVDVSRKIKLLLREIIAVKSSSVIFPFLPAARECSRRSDDEQVVTSKIVRLSSYLWSEFQAFSLPQQSIITEKLLMPVRGGRILSNLQFMQIQL